MPPREGENGQAEEIYPWQVAGLSWPHQTMMLV